MASSKKSAPKKPSKPVVSGKKTVTKKPAAAKQRVSSRSKGTVASTQRAVRFRFVMIVALVAAVLLSLIGGLMIFKDKADIPTPRAGHGLLFVRSSGSGAKTGDTVTVELYAASGDQPVNALQAAIRYPQDRLKVTSVASSGIFPLEAATDTATPGLVRLARAVNRGSKPVSGSHLVATINFVVTVDSDKALSITTDLPNSFLVRSTDNTNIL